jgi:hypothetical protein
MAEHADESIAEWGSMRELKPRFGISQSTGYRLAAAGLIDVRKIGARSLVNFASVRRHLARQPIPELKQDARAIKLARSAA